jgi:hypothetical protein
MDRIMTSEASFKDTRSARRRFIKVVGTALCAAPAALALRDVAAAADLPLLSESDPTAKALKYFDDVKSSKTDPTHVCAKCALYGGSAGSAQGPCKVFPKNQVKAGGTCSAWAPQM